MSFAGRMVGHVTRKKTLQDDMMETPLRRCLNTFDLTLLGIGHMVGAGLFVLTGTVVRNVAGPGTILSYLLAGMAAVLASLCYAEFGSRVPKAGSAYTYTYVTIGELCAFVIGWNIVLEHMLGIASVARAWSGALDAMLGGVLKNGTLTYLGHMRVKGLSEYPDVVALSVVLAVMVFVACGAKASANVNNVFTFINLIVIVLIVTIGFSLGDGANWALPARGDGDAGGFLPFGFTGVFAGAATCFYAYIGFEGIAVAGEEAKRPEKSIPIATGLAVAISTVLYFGSSAALTLLVPYSEVDMAAPFPTAFARRGLHWAKVIIAVGTLFGISTSLIGGLFSMPRSIYAMAADGLCFRWFAYVHPKYQTPLVAVVASGAASGITALLVDIDVLVEFLSIGTLMSFTIVAASVLILRYQPAADCPFKLRPEEPPPDDDDDTAIESDQRRRIIRKSQSHDNIGRLRATFATMPVLKRLAHDRSTSTAVVTMTVFMTAFSALVIFGGDSLMDARWWSIVLLFTLFLGVAASFAVLLMHEQNTSFLTFQVPLVPLLPSLSMFFNIAMMLKLNYLTWIRLAIWMSIGFVIYFGYGISHSLENKPLSTYSHMISYSGSEPADSLAGAFDQTIHKPQPDIDQHPVIDEQPEGAESGEEQWAEPTRAARDD